MFARIFIILMVNIVIGVSSIAQTVGYKITRDAPNEVHKLQLRWNPIYFDLFLANGSTIGAGVEARYSLKNDMMFSLNRWGSYLTVRDGDNGRFVCNEFYVQYPLIVKLKNKNVNIKLSESLIQTSDERTVTSTSIKVPSTVKYITAISGGVFQYRSPIWL